MRKACRRVMNKRARKETASSNQRQDRSKIMPVRLMTVGQNQRVGVCCCVAGIGGFVGVASILEKAEKAEKSGEVGWTNLQENTTLSGGKQMMEDYENKREVALRIAIEAGVLEQCEDHDECVFEGHEEIKQAYILANSKYTTGELEGVFVDKQEMTDIIKEVVEDNPASDCPLCDKNKND